MVGIVSYGVYIPMLRIKIEEIAKIWKQEAEAYKHSLIVEEKSVPSLDEDTTTISVEATRNALRRVPEIKPQEIMALYVGSESHQYAVKPTATTVAEAIGATPSLTAADLEFACKAGTAGIQACMGLVKGGYIKYGLAVGADTAQARPGDVLEYTVGAGAAAYLIGNKPILAEIEGTYSCTEDIPDFWRRDGAQFPQHGGRFTGEPAYFTQVLGATNGLLRKLDTTPEDYDYVVFHEPNGKFPLRAAKILGFSREKVLPGLIVTEIGNTYSASALLGLANVLDVAKPDERILVTSYGSGAGSDAFSITVKDGIEEKRNLSPSVKYYLDRKKYVDYASYLKFRGQLKGWIE